MTLHWRRHTDSLPNTKYQEMWMSCFCCKVNSDSCLCGTSALYWETFQQLQDFWLLCVAILGFLYVTQSFQGNAIPVILYLVSCSKLLAQVCFTPLEALELPLPSKSLSHVPRVTSHCHYNLCCVGSLYLLLLPLLRTVLISAAETSSLSELDPCLDTDWKAAHTQKSNTHHAGSN